jgi:hypothetical protein
MIRAGRLIILLIILFISGIACDFEGDAQKKLIGQTLYTLKKAINAEDKYTMGLVFSKDYDHAGLQKENIINSILNKKTYITAATVENIYLNELRNQAHVVAAWQSKGGTAKVRIPVFQQTATVNLEQTSRMQFFLQKEGNDKWRIIKAVQLDIVKSASSGYDPPNILDLSYSADNPRHGDTVEMRIKVIKGQDDSAVFLAVNDILLGGYSVQGLSNAQVNDDFVQMFQLPPEIPYDGFYKVKVLLFEGKVNTSYISMSELTGLRYKEVLLPVR